MAAKRIVITGASSGIGAATAEAFAAKGAEVVLAARGQEGLEEVAARCRALGGTAHAFAVDVTDMAAVERLAAHAQDVMGGIDLWFSDVGIGVVGRFHEVPVEAHERVIAANLIGHVHDAYAALPIFIAQGHGTFVNMISVGGFVATPYAAAYSASKFGLRGFSQALRGELSKHPRIHICDIYPTFVDTPGIDHAGNYAGGKLGLPPGSLDPRSVARAVVRLADRPRNTVVVGAPAPLLVLTQAFAPNVTAAVMSGFMDRYFARADYRPDSDGALHEAGEPLGVDGGRRHPERRRAAAVAGGVGAAAIGLGAVLWLRRGKAGKTAGPIDESPLPPPGNTGVATPPTPRT